MNAITRTNLSQRNFTQPGAAGARKVKRKQHSRARSLT